MVLILVVRSKLGSAFYKKYFVSVLVDSCDIEKHKELINTGKVFTFYGLELVACAFYSGDYQTVVNICNEKLNNKKYKRFKNSYLLYLVGTYLMLNDIEKMKYYVELFERDCDSLANGEAIKKRFPIMQAYRMFVDGDFAGFLEYHKNLEPDFGKSVFINRVTFDFRYALALYKCGKFDEAKERFESVLSQAPQLNYAVVSQEYLQAIEAGVDYSPEVIDVVPDENYVTPGPSRTAKALRIAFVSCLIVCFASLVVSSFIQSVKNAENERLLEMSHEAISQKYSSYEIIDFFSVRGKGMKSAMTFCLFDTQDGLEFGYTYLPLKSEKSAYQSIGKKMVSGSVTSFPIDDYREIELGVCSDRESVPNTAKISFSIITDEKSVWFYIESIGDENLEIKRYGYKEN